MTMMLLVRNDYDPITHYMFCLSEPLCEAAERRSITPRLVDGPEATRSNILSRIRKLAPRFICLNGHGDRSSFACSEGRERIDEKDAPVFQRTVVFARACDCVVNLGAAAAENGCEAFIGYEREFMNVRQLDLLTKPLADEVSRPIWEASNAVALGLLKGKTVGEAMQAAHDKTDQRILDLVYSDHPAAETVLKALLMNDEGLT